MISLISLLLLIFVFYSLSLLVYALTPPSFVFVNPLRITKSDEWHVGHGIDSVSYCPAGSIMVVFIAPKYVCSSAKFDSINGG